MIRNHCSLFLFESTFKALARKVLLAMVLIAYSVLSASECYSKKKPLDNTWKKDKYKILINDIPLWVDISDSDEERRQGLMNRKSLHKNEGMLFVFDAPQPLSFWMKNTFLSLDIAFIDKLGTIISIQSMKALDEKKRYKSPSPALYALEVNHGWFASNNIEVGNKVSF